MYGLWEGKDSFRNLKTKRYNSRMALDDTMVITYNKQEQTVRFTCKTFEFYQTGLPKDTDFKIATAIYCKPQKMTINFLEVT